MPITQQQLNDNYYLAIVVYLCDYKSPYTKRDPETKKNWAFTLRDDGLGPGPQPYIKTWAVMSHAQPPNSLLMENCSLEMIAMAKVDIYGI